MIIAGLGCRRGCTAAELRELLEQTLAQLALPLSALDGLASSALKRDEVGLLQLAAELKLPLDFYPAEQLAAYELTGAASVAEASALAGASARSGRAALLICPKQRSAAATLAIARA